MNTHFRKSKTLELRTMAGDALKVDVNEATSFFLDDFDDVLYVCGFVRRTSTLSRTLGL